MCVMFASRRPASPARCEPSTHTLGNRLAGRAGWLTRWAGTPRRCHVPTAEQWMPLPGAPEAGDGRGLRSLACQVHRGSGARRAERTKVEDMASVTVRVELEPGSRPCWGRVAAGVYCNMWPVGRAGGEIDALVFLAGRLAVTMLQQSGLQQTRLPDSRDSECDQRLAGLRQGKGVALRTRMAPIFGDEAPGCRVRSERCCAGPLSVKG